MVIFNEEIWHMSSTGLFFIEENVMSCEPRGSLSIPFCYRPKTGV